MKYWFCTILLFICFQKSYAQTTDIRSMVDSLKFLTSDSIDCDAVLYWRIISKGEKAIPFLIDKLADTTPTNISFHCKKTKLNVGELAYFALTQIASFPAFVITHIQFDVIYEGGCWSFYDYLFDNRNKLHYQQLVRDWYKVNKSKFIVRRIAKKDQNECLRRYKIDRYMEWSD